MHCVCPWQIFIADVTVSVVFCLRKLNLSYTCVINIGCLQTCMLYSVDLVITGFCMEIYGIRNIEISTMD